MCSMTLQAIFPYLTSTDQCVYSGQFNNGMNWSLPKGGNIFLDFLKLLTRKRTKKKKPKAAHDTREYEKKMTRKLSAKWKLAGRPWLKHEEEKGMICEWYVENIQSLSWQNVLNATRFYIDSCTSYKMESISYQEKSAVHLLAQL